VSLLLVGAGAHMDLPGWSPHSPTIYMTTHSLDFFSIHVSCSRPIQNLENVAEFSCHHRPAYIYKPISCSFQQWACGLFWFPVHIPALSCAYVELELGPLSGGMVACSMSMAIPSSSCGSSLPLGTCVGASVQISSTLCDINKNSI
jgi:hypothetical protein